MQFNSFEYLLFFPIVVLVLLIIPKRIRSIWLLITSYYFYMAWNFEYALLIGFSTIVTFVGGIYIEKVKNERKKKVCLLSVLIANLLILAIFKYANFMLDSFSSVCQIFNINFTNKRFDLLLPVGISFYTFQALGYIIDVYRQKISAEKNIINYALFVSFFPQLVAGPIERSGNLLKQIQKIKELQLYNYERIRDGLMLMFWGLFQKMVIADRASILVNEIFENYKECGLIEIALASFLFAFQIYCDFGGYTNIARGSAKVMGFDLMNNFRQPYFAYGIKDFWDRWHISLTKWFTDYLYIPLGGNKKGRLRKYINILVVFCASGLWHGASWNFVAWGLIHAGYRIIGEIKYRFEKMILKRKADIYVVSRRIRDAIITFVLVDFAWIFFASDNLNNALHIIYQMFTRIEGSYKIQMSTDNQKVLFLSLAVLFVVDIVHEMGVSIFKFVNKQEIWFRWFLYLGLIWSIILLGVYGKEYDATQFIYFQF